MLSKSFNMIYHLSKTNIDRLSVILSIVFITWLTTCSRPLLSSVNVFGSWTSSFWQGPTGTPCSRQTLVMVNKHLAPGEPQIFLDLSHNNVDFEIPDLIIQVFGLCLKDDKSVVWLSRLGQPCRDMCWGERLYNSTLWTPFCTSCLGGLWWICFSVIAQRMLDQMDNHRSMLMPLQYPLHTSIIGKLMNNVTKHTETIRNYIDPGVMKASKVGGRLTSHHREDWHSNLWHGGVHGSFQTLGAVSEIASVGANNSKKCWV